MNDGQPDFFIAAADDFRFGLMEADYQDFVQNEGIDDDQKNAVEDLFRVGEKHLGDQDQKVEGVQQDGNRKTEFFVQDKGRDIHAPRGGAYPDDDPDSGSYHQAPENGAQHMVVRHVGQDGKALPEGQGGRIEKGADQGSQGEFFAEDESSGGEHDQVERKDESGYGDVQKVFGGQREACGAARDYAAGQNEGDHGQGIQGVSGQNHQYIPDAFRD